MVVARIAFLPSEGVEGKQRAWGAALRFLFDAVLKRLGDAELASDAKNLEAFTERGSSDSEEFGGTHLVALSGPHRVEDEFAFEPREQLEVRICHGGFKKRFDSQFPRDNEGLVASRFVR